VETSPTLKRVYKITGRDFTRQLIRGFASLRPNSPIGELLLPRKSLHEISGMKTDKFTIDDAELKAKRALMRADFDVALEKGKTVDSQMARWIASDALRELTSAAVRNRFKARR